VVKVSSTAYLAQYVAIQLKYIVCSGFAVISGMRRMTMVRSVDPRTGAEFGPEFPEADKVLVDQVLARAVRAGDVRYRA
jgi:hypothetical protein